MVAENQHGILTTMTRNLGGFLISRQSVCMRVRLLHSIINFLPPVNFGDPTAPMDGSINPYQNTTEGAEIYRSCAIQCLSHLEG